MMNIKNKNKICHHFPIIGNNDWEVVHQDMNVIVRKCKKCGQVDESVLYHGNYADNSLSEQRRTHAKDLVQPYRDGQASKEFAEIYPEQAKKYFNSNDKPKYVYGKDGNLSDLKK